MDQNEREALVGRIASMFETEGVENLSPLLIVPLLAQCGGDLPSIMEEAFQRIGEDLPADFKAFLEQTAPMFSRVVGAMPQQPILRPIGLDGRPAVSAGLACETPTERTPAPLPEKEDMLRRIAAAEARLGVVLPQSYKEFVVHVPGYGVERVQGFGVDGSSSWHDTNGPDLVSYDGDICITGPLLNPEHLKPLSDERWNYGSAEDPCWAWAGDEEEPGLVGEIRTCIIPFVEDGAGNAYAFWFDGSVEPKVVDCDHEDVENWERKTKPSFQAFLDDKYSNFLPGSTICFTGKLSVSREEAHAQARARGMIPVDSVTKKTKFLVVGEDAGASKLAKAESLGVRILEADGGWQDILDNT